MHIDNISAIVTGGASGLGAATVNTIAPGIVDTSMLAMVGDYVRAGVSIGVPFPQRLFTADEYAKLVKVIVDHDYLDGETIRMDGAVPMAPR